MYTGHGIIMQLGLWKRTANSSGRRPRHSGHLSELRFLDIINTYIVQAKLLRDLEGVLVDEYENTRGTWIDIRELARSIAAASGEIGIALRPNDLWAPRRIAQCGAYR